MKESQPCPHSTIIKECKPCPNKKYELHHLSCTESTRKQKEHANKILEQIKKKNIKGIIIYFHGGLSSECYMECTLGPALMQSIFTKSNLSGSPEHNVGELYPVFFNYKAGLLEKKPFDLDNEIKDKIGLKKFKKVNCNFEKFYKKGIKTNSSLADYAQTLLREVGVGDGTRGTISTKTLTDLLKNKNKQQQEKIGKKLLKENDELRDIVMTLTSKVSRKKIIFLKWRIWVAIARTLIRIAVGNNHQIIPTFEEELFRAFGIKKIADKHWRKVKSNAKRIFKNNRIGKYFLDEILKIKQSKEKDNKSFTINAMSHSTGAIPAARLAKYMNKDLDNNVMVAPAINQKDFYKLIIRNKEHIKNLKLHILRKKVEEEDNVVIIYPASLLYFVSGTAENVWYGDKMILIEQHLQRDKKPYNSDDYLDYIGVKETAKDVWDFFDKNPDMIDCYKNKNIYSHECTKYPWATKDLAQKILHQLHSGDVSQDHKFTIEEPKCPNLKKKCKSKNEFLC